MTPVLAPAPPAVSLAHRQRLLDVYGALLTDHQREACRLHLDEDWSYAELATSLGTTRSAAHDLVRRALEQLERYEQRLGHARALGERDQREARMAQRIGELEQQLRKRG